MAERMAPTHSNPSSPRLILVCGLPGSGKSTAARLIAARLSAVSIVNDAVRRELFAVRTYSQKESNAIYAAVFERTRQSLAAGEHTVVDATNGRAAWRCKMMDLAHALGAHYAAVYVTVTDAVAAARLNARTADLSEADFGVYLLMKPTFEPPCSEHTIVIDNSSDLAELHAQIDRYFGHSCR